MEFILESNKKTAKIEDIKQQLTSDLLKELIIAYFSKEENEEIIKHILEDYNISISYKVNPRHSTIVRDGISYNSYVRRVEDNNDYGSYDVQYAPLKYKITMFLSVNFYWE